MLSFSPMLRGEPLIQLHAMDYDVYENGDLRFAFSEDSEAAITGLFAIHAYSGLIVSQYSLRPRDLDFLGPSALNQTHTLKVKVSYFLSVLNIPKLVIDS